VVAFFLASRASAAEIASKVCILGAGMSGVTTAAQLEENGHTDYVLIEGRDVLGGRMQPTTFRGHVVEAGANWIQGAGGSNPIWLMKQEVDLQGNFNDWDQVTVYNKDGWVPDDDIPWDESEAANDNVDEQGVAKNALGQTCPNPDINVRAAYDIAGWRSKGDAIRSALEYWDNDWEYAEPPEGTSLMANHPSATYAFADADYFVTDPRGYVEIVRHVGAGIPSNKYHFNRQAEQIDWGNADGKVRVRAKHVDGSALGVGTDSGPEFSFLYSRDSLTTTTRAVGMPPRAAKDKRQDQFDEFICEYLVSTVSVGVLEWSDLRWVPALPDEKIEAINFFSMNDYVKIFMTFNDSPEAMQFWTDLESESVHDIEDIEVWVYADEYRGYYPIWQNLNITKFFPGTGLVIVTVTGDEATRILHFNDPAQIREEIHGVLVNMFSPEGTVVPYPDDIYFPKMRHNPLLRGSFSNWPTGVEVYDHNALRNPIGDRVVFSGEATSDDYPGYVHGAYFSGLEASLSIMQALDGRGLKTYETAPPAPDTSGSEGVVVSGVIVSLLALIQLCFL
jgi:polyamine oxidase